MAAFASGSSGRLWKVQAVAALTATACLLGFVLLAVIPAVDRAVLHLPERAAIRGGRLLWPDANPAPLGGNTVLSFHVDPVAARAAGAGADLGVVLGPGEVRIDSWFGHVRIDYPKGYFLDLGRDAADAWWRAWQPVFLIGFCVAVFVGMIGLWWVVALTYAIPVRWLAGAMGRELSFRGAWFLANAALVPGAMLVCLAVLLYGMHRLSFAGLLLAWCLHLPLSWVYAAVAPLRLPRRTAAGRAARANPFRPGKAGGQGTRRGAANPFAGKRNTP